jgi:hypothetical protein
MQIATDMPLAKVFANSFFVIRDTRASFTSGFAGAVDEPPCRTIR